MGGSLHYIFKCVKCKEITGQCRCPDKNKMVRWVESCWKCDLEKKDDLSNRKPKKSRGSKNSKPVKSSRARGIR